MNHLPQRLTSFKKRCMKLCREGWDLNTLSVVYEEAQALTGACGTHGQIEISDQLLSIEVFLSSYRENAIIPNAKQLEDLEQLVTAIDPSRVQATEAEQAKSAGQHIDVRTRAPQSPSVSHIPFSVKPPDGFFKENASITVLHPVAPSKPPAAPAVEPEPDPPKINDSLTALDDIEDTEPEDGTTSEPSESPPVTSQSQPEPEVMVAEASAPSRPVAVTKSDHKPQLLFLTPADDNRIQDTLADRFDIERLDDVDELKEWMSAVVPDGLVIGAKFSQEVAELGNTLRKLRQRSGKRIPFIVFSNDTEIKHRLDAMRAGADAFFPADTPLDAIRERLSEMLLANSGDPFKILIVEDDRSQALFASSILRKAGMETKVVSEALKVMETLDEFPPDLILMDLYMPGCDGMELTAVIRERDAFLSTPIVFLSGEQDEEKHFDALSIGGDDFLAKPIQPRHLISAVTNRVRRARSLQRRKSQKRDPATGLAQRLMLLDRVDRELSKDQLIAATIVYVEIDVPYKVREKLGLVLYEQLLKQLAVMITQTFSGEDLAARYSDTAFAILHFTAPEVALDEHCATLREQINEALFEVEDEAVSISVSIGLADLSQDATDAGALVSRAERACVKARHESENGVFRYGDKSRNTPSGDDTDTDDLIAELRQAVDDDRLQLVYQPIVSMRGDPVAQYQSMLRF